MNFEHLVDTNFWVAIHTHRHGMDIYPFTSDTEPNNEAIIAACDIEFEPDREEYIDIVQVSLNEQHVPHIDDGDDE